MSTLNLLQADHATLTEILHARRSVSMETLKVGDRIAWQIYLALLADALNTLDSLIDHLRESANGDE